MRRSGRGPDWIRRCGTVLTRTLELVRKRGLIDSISLNHFRNRVSFSQY